MPHCGTRGNFQALVTDLSHASPKRTPNGSNRASGAWCPGKDVPARFARDRDRAGGKDGFAGNPGAGRHRMGIVAYWATGRTLTGDGGAGCALQRGGGSLLLRSMNRTLHDHALAYFDAVRRHGSIREAARRLDIAASAINRQIMKLEVAVGTKLFDRWPDGMKLTPAGEIFARHAIAVLHEEVRALEELDALRGLRRGKISLIAAESLNAAFLPSLVETMAGKFPGIALSIRTAGSNVIPAAVISGEADLGIAFSLAHHSDLAQLALGRFRFGAVMRADHPLARESRVSLADCARYRLVLPGNELSIHTLLERQVKRFRGRLEVVAEVGSTELIKRIVLLTGAIAFQARLGLENELRDGSLVHVPFKPEDSLMTELGVYARKDRALPVALDTFVAMLKDEIALYERAEA